ncbi:MAG: phosphatase PAP2 family protein [Acidobacteria bacterium]|nr:phosphatase PAP2 family protein [Acidobacteriota bacterium]
METRSALSTVRQWLTATLHRYVTSLDVQALAVLAGALLTVVAALAFIVVAGSVMEGDTQKIDEAIVQWFRQPGNPNLARGPAWLTEVAIDITALGSTVVLVMLVGAVAGFLWLQGQTRLMLLLLAAMAGGTLLNALMKTTFARPRPTVVPHLREVFTYSFPSGHAALSAIVYLTIGVLLFEVVRGRAARLYCLGVAMTATALVGFSRVFLGVHYPSDVLAGWAAGIGWAGVCWLAVQYVAHRKVDVQ